MSWQMFWFVLLKYVGQVGRSLLHAVSHSVCLNFVDILEKPTLMVHLSQSTSRCGKQLCESVQSPVKDKRSFHRLQQALDQILQNMPNTDFCIKSRQFYMLRFSTFREGQLYKKECTYGIYISFQWHMKKPCSIYMHFVQATRLSEEKKRMGKIVLPMSLSAMVWLGTVPSLLTADVRVWHPYKVGWPSVMSWREKKLSLLSNFPVRKWCANGSNFYHSLITLNIHLH